MAHMAHRRKQEEKPVGNCATLKTSQRTHPKRTHPNPPRKRCALQYNHNISCHVSQKHQIERQQHTQTSSRHYQHHTDTALIGDNNISRSQNTER